MAYSLFPMLGGNRPVLGLLLAAAIAPAVVHESFPEPAPVEDAAVTLGPSERYLVHFEDTILNPSAETLRDVRCELLLPLADARQRVEWLRLSAHDWSIRTDSHGQRVATATVDALGPGEVVRFGWLASIESRAAWYGAGRFPGNPAPAGAGHLGDTRELGLDSPAVRRAADEVRSRASGPEVATLAREAWSWVQENLEYAREGPWDPAPEVIERGSGSCSEATFAFMAIARRLGVHARWIGGTLLRRGPAGRPVDRTFHRSAEFWDPSSGWVPVDPTPAVRAAGRGVFGRLGRGYLVLARGDGSGDAGAGVLYHSRASWSRPRGTTKRLGRTVKRAAWLAAPEPGLTGGPPEGLAAGYAPSFPVAELMVADAAGYGPPLGADLRPLDGAVEPSPEAPEVRARRLFQAGHPLALRVAARFHRIDPEGARALVERHCRPDLADAFLERLTRTDADVAAWLLAHDDRVAPAGRGQLSLAR
jgi:transglutaminase-like putative cysteine protease